MYWMHKLIVIMVFAAPIIINYYYNLKISDALASNIFTLVGILFGFTITASMAMQGNGFIAKQAKIIDSNGTGIRKTNAQRLCEYVNFACLSDILLIVILVVKSFIMGDGLVSSIVNIIIVGMLGVVLVSSYLVLRIVMNFYEWLDGMLYCHLWTLQLFTLL